MKHLLLLLFFSFSAFAQDDVWVNGYYKSDGTYIEGHYKTNPNQTVNDNYSTVGNLNPYTGEWGDKPRETSTLINIRPDIPACNTVNPIALPFKSSTYYYDKVGEADRIEEDLRKHLKSPLNTAATPEMSFSDAMNTLNDNKFNFKEYNIKPSNVYDELPSGKLKPKKSLQIQPTATTNIPEKDLIDDSSRKIAILIVGLIAVFVTFITLLFSKRNKRF
jgi:hypothetical protein